MLRRAAMVFAVVATGGALSATPGSTAVATRTAALASGPANDAFASAQALTGATGSVTADTTGATIEQGEPQIVGNSGGHSVWYAWTAPASGTATFDTHGSAFDTTLAVYTGSTLGGLSKLAENDDTADRTSALSFAASAGTTYRIQVDGYAGTSHPPSSGALTLAWSAATASGGPANDAFANAQPLSGASGSVTGDTTAATVEPGEPQIVGNTGGHSLWYRWTAPANGSASLDTHGSAFDTTLAVYTGSALGGLSKVAESDDSTDRTSALAFSAVAGTTYRIQVDGYTGTSQPPSSGALKLTYSQAATGPANDAFANALALSGASGSTTGDTTGATLEAGEPRIVGNSGGHSLWYAWTAPASGTASFDTHGSAFDTTLAVYTGTTLAGLSKVAESDDSSDRTSALTFTAAAGTTYRVQVDGYAGTSQPPSSGPLTLNWSSTVPPSGPPNDAFANPQTLSGSRGSVTGDTTTATVEAGEPQIVGNSGGHSVWYAYTPTTSGTVAVDTHGSAFDTTLAVYTGTSLAGLSKVAESDDSSDRTSALSFAATAGTTYRIQVDGYTGTSHPPSSGPLTLSWAGAAPSSPPPANDTVAAATAFAPRALSASGSNVGATAEPGEPAHAGQAATASVWFTWTATASGTLTLDTNGASFATVLAVYTGSRVDDLQPVAGSVGGSTSFTARFGTTYLFAVDGRYGATGSFTLHLSWPAPANDSFTSAQPLPGRNGLLDGNTLAATLESGEPRHAGRLGAASVWFRWTAPSDGRLHLEAGPGYYGSGFDTLLAVYTGMSVTALTPVGADDDSGWSLGSSLTVPVQAGVVYDIAVAGDATSGDATLQKGYYTLSWSLQQLRPANDAFGDAELVDGDASDGSYGPYPKTVDTTYATTQPGEPAHANTVGGHSVWYEWIASSDVREVFATTGSTFDTVLAVYTGDDLTSLHQVGWNDNAAPGVTTSAVAFNPTPGTRYWIAIDGVGGAAGTAHLLWDQALDLPPNDHFSSAYLLDGTSGSLDDVSIGATVEPGEPQHAHVVGGASVWFEWTAPETRVERFAIDTYVFGAALAVYTGTSVDHLTEVTSALATASADPSVTFRAIAGTTYRIAFDGYHGNAGPYTLTWQAPPANDDFVNAVTLTGATGTVTGSTLYASHEAGEPDYSTSLYWEKSVWYRWTPTTGGTYAFALADGWDKVALITTGSRVDRLTTVASVLTGSESTVNVTAGTTYWIGVAGDTWWYDARPVDGFTLSWRPSAARPANDDLVAAQSIGGAVGTVAGTTVGATREAAEPDTTYGPGTTVWYAWTAPTGGEVSVDTEGSSSGTLLGVYTGGAYPLTGVATRNENLYSGQRLSWTATAGTTYDIRVDADGPWHGPIRVNWSMAAPPNDDFANAITLAGNTGSRNGDRDTTYRATTEPGEPDNAGYSVWYRWTPTIGGTAEVDAELDNGRWDIYTGTSLSTLTSIASGSGWNAAYRFPATAGTTYYIRASGWTGEIGRLDWSVDATRPAVWCTRSGGLLAVHLGPGGAARIVRAGNAIDVVSPTLADPTCGGASVANTSTVELWSDAPGADGITLDLSGGRFDGVTFYPRFTSWPNRFAVVGSAGDDAIGWYPDGIDLDGDGYDDVVVQGMWGFGAGSTLDGGAGNDVLETTTGVTLRGGPGDDYLLTSGAPADGGAGIDTVSYEDALSAVRASLAGTTNEALVGSPYADVLTGSAGADTIDGGDGNDVVDGGAGDDILRGGAGQDTLLSGAGNDRLDGGIGTDTADFSAAAGPITADLAAGTVTGDGSDTIAGIETVIGTDAGDTLRGSDGPDTLLGGRGADTVAGRGGDDTLAGGDGTDVLRGDAGNDTLSARDATTDDVACGDGTDTVAADGADGVAADCETVDRSGPPANDDILNPQLLGGASGTLAESTVRATTAPGDGSIAGFPARSTVWFRWQPSATGKVTIDTVGSDFDTLLAVTGPDEFGNTSVIGQSDDAAGAKTSGVSFTVPSASATYLIEVAGKDGDTGNLVLHWGAPLGPVPDAFADARTITGETGSASTDTTTATREAGEPTHAGATGGKSVWFTWTAPRDGTFQFLTNSASFDTLLAVYTGNALTSLAPIASNDDVGTVKTSRVQFAVTAGTVYRIAIDGKNGAGGAVTLAWSRVITTDAGAPTARFVSPADGSWSSGISWTITAAADDDYGVKRVEFWIDGTLRSTVTSPAPQYTYEWYTGSQPPVPEGPHTVTVRAYDGSGNVGSATETLSLDRTAPVLSVSRSGDTFTFGANEPIVKWVCSLDSGQQTDCSATETMPVAAGQHSLYVRGTDRAGNLASTRYTWTADAAPAPANDAFASAARIDGATGYLYGTTVGATREAGEPDHRYALGAHSVWYRWTAPHDGIFVFTANGQSGGTPVVAVYTTASTAATASGSSIDWTTFGFVANAGTDYWIAVDGVQGTTGTFRLVWTDGLDHSDPPSAPANDDWGDAQGIAGASGSVSGTTVGATYEPRAPHADPANDVWYDAATNDVWYAWTAPVSAAATFDTIGSTFDTELDVYSGTAVDNLTRIAQDEDSGGAGRSRLTFAAHAGTTYWIQVDGYGSATGSVQLNWRIASDATPPTVALTGPAEGATVTGPVTVTATASDDVAVARVEWLVGGRVVASDESAPYSATWTPSADQAGAVTLTARAVDTAANTATTAPVHVTVALRAADGTAPDTEIVVAPGDPILSRSASFTLRSDEDGATFQCSLDGAAFAACTSPVTYTGVADGDHTFAARAVDAAGNVDPSPATTSWTVAPVGVVPPPDTTIDSGPASSTTETLASFVFSSDDPDAIFECQLDAARDWQECDSPTDFRSLDDGPHTFRVRAVDVYGVADPTPATFSWTVARSGTPPPDTTITGGPDGTTSATSATFTFAATDPAATFECAIDGAAWARCTSPASYTGLLAGSHTFAVRATGGAGTDPTPATRAWTVSG